MYKILYIASEVDPFIKTGGLADVAGSLPNYLRKMGHDCRVVMPYYSQIPEMFKSKTQLITSFVVDIGWKKEICNVRFLLHNNVPYYFLESEAYFNRSKIYGEYDDAERFIFFSKAATRLPRVINFKPDIMHSNDWHSGLVNVYVDDYRVGDDFYNDVKTVFTIHNLKYQGQFGEDVFYWTNLSGSYMNDYDLKFYNSINFLKGAIVHANWVTTVSKTYAEEIKYPFFGEGLDAVLRHYDFKLSGIVNGIDTDLWNPETDPHIMYNYDSTELSKKLKNKEILQKEYGFEVNKKIPLIAIVSRLNSMKGMDLVRYILDELLSENIQLVVLGTGDYEYEDMFRYFAYKYPDKMRANIYYSNEESHKIYAGADLFLMPSLSEPCGLSQIISMRYGTLPVVREAGGLKDTVLPYNMYDGSGTGFSFSNINAHDFLYTLKSAISLYYEDNKSFLHLQKAAMKQKLDWEESSKKYCEVYDMLVRK